MSMQPPAPTPITRSYSNAVHPSGFHFHAPHLSVYPAMSIHHPSLSTTVPPPLYRQSASPAVIHQPPLVTAPAPVSVSARGAGGAGAGGDVGRLERLLQESRRELEESRRRAREATEQLEQEVLVLREQVSHLTSLLKTSSSPAISDESEILRGKFEALTKINTTLRNENKSLNFRLKHEFVPLADYELLANKLNNSSNPGKLDLPPPSSSAPRTSIRSAALPTLPSGGFGTLFPLPEQQQAPVLVHSARASLPSLQSLQSLPSRSSLGSSGGRKSLVVDMKPLDLENLRPANALDSDSALGKNPTAFPARHTARQTARLQAEEEEKRALERRVAEASEGVVSMTKEEAVDFASKLIGNSVPKVHAMRIFRSVCGEDEEIRSSPEIREFARRILLQLPSNH